LGKWRWPSWALVAWGVVAVVVSIGIIVSTSDPNQAGYTVGKLTWVWIIGFVALGVAWHQFRPGKACPRCGLNLPMSATVCPRCGYYPGMPSDPSA
jgi:hypothetical protein